MHVLTASFGGNPNVGLYIHVTRKYVLVGNEVPQKFYKDIQKVMGLPVKKVSIAGTSFCGVFLASNTTHLLVPKIIFDEELEQLKKLRLNPIVFDTKLTCLGNNILLNDKAALVNPEFTKHEVQELYKILGVPVAQHGIADAEAVGSCAIMNSKGMLVHHEASDDEIRRLSQYFQVPAEEGSANMGSPYVRSGIVCNDNGFIIGDQSGGPEITHVDEVLGFLDN
ncbi:translation initiation factor IF-6 [Candidatus Woesearchaeota archaeon]|nr:translation initiation factor IF-6 [Candidatus Woesearchaeota archaeon]